MAHKTSLPQLIFCAVTEMLNFCSLSWCPIQLIITLNVKPVMNETSRKIGKLYYE